MTSPVAVAVAPRVRQKRNPKPGEVCRAKPPAGPCTKPATLFGFCPDHGGFERAGICSGMSKRTGKRCGQHHTKTPAGKCRHHGGAALTGSKAPGYIDGRALLERAARTLPARLQGAYEAALDNPRYLELRGQLAVMDARETDILTRLDSGEAGRWWTLFSEAMDALRVARAKNDDDAREAALVTLEEIDVASRTEGEAWRDLFELYEQRRRLVDTERRTMEADRRVVSRERAEYLALMVAGTIKRHVSDPEVVDAVFREVDDAMRRALGVDGTS